ncbi:MAG: PP2C family protein-serine/threonine phosphatase, partial [Mycobacteriales bacterium]
AIRAASATDADPSATLSIVNDVLLRHDTDRFCTALLVRLRLVEESWTASICTAGHPLPVLIEADGSSGVVGSPGSLLGVMPTIDTASTEIELRAGRRLLLYTDGVTEARREDEEYGEARLLRTAARAARGSAALVEHVLHDVLAFQQEVPRDDIALLALGRE